jgi:membrane-bound ClpP family serine protease
MFVNADPELVAGVSIRGLFLELLASPPVDFLMITLGFVGIGVLYPPPGVCKLP